MKISKTFLVGACIVVFVAKLFLFREREGEITNFPPPQGNIIAFGDGLVSGVVASLPEKNFVSLLQTKAGHPITNAGVSGDGSAVQVMLP